MTKITKVIQVSVNVMFAGARWAALNISENAELVEFEEFTVKGLKKGKYQ